MNKSASLHVTYANKEYDYAAAGEEYWLKMEQVKATNSVSKDTVADVIDTLYDIEVCNQEEPEADAEQDEGLPFDEEEFAAAIQKELNPNWCNEVQHFAYTTQIKVYRSHPSEPYRLNITNGAILQTVRTTGRATVKITMNGSDLAMLPTPVSSDFKAEVSGGTLVDDNGNPIDMTVSSGSIQFSAEIHGSMSVSYNTEYDLVNVYVNGFGTEPESALAIAEYHGLFYELEITPPDGLGEDWIDREKYCKKPGVRYEIGDPSDDVTCYENITYQNKCKCSDSIASEWVEQVIIPCPRDDYKCLTPGSLMSDSQYSSDPNYRYKCSAYMGSRTVFNGYVDCDIVLRDPMGNERARTSETSILADAEYYEEQCCLPPTAELPDCQTKYSKNPGGKSIDPAKEAEYRADWQDRVEFIGITPKDNDCGTIKTVVAVNARNCCIEGTYELITIDVDESVSVIPDNSYGWVSLVHSSFGPLRVTVRGEGFYATESGSKTAVYNSTSKFLVYTKNACGMATVTISDNCTTITHRIRSTEGKWGPMVGDVFLGQEVAVSGLHGEEYARAGDAYGWVAEQDGIRQYEWWGRTIASAAYNNDGPACSAGVYDTCGIVDKCPLGVIGPRADQCYKFGSVFANRPYYWEADCDGCDGGECKSCKCLCTSGNSYEEWEC